MVTDFLMFFSLLGCKILKNMLFGFFLCHSYEAKRNDMKGPRFNICYRTLGSDVAGFNFLQGQIEIPYCMEDWRSNPSKF